MQTETATVSLTRTSCATCGIVFAVPAQWLDERRGDGDRFYCPNGHGLSFGETEAQRLRKELERQKRCCDLQRARAAHLEEQVEYRERQVRGYKGALAKAKKRAAPAQGGGNRE